MLFLIVIQQVLNKLRILLAVVDPHAFVAAVARGRIPAH